MSEFIIDFFAVMLAGLSGWLLAIFMGHANFPKDHVERAAVGPIWISIAGIICFFGGAPLFWVNLLCGLSVAGFLARSLWEYGVRCQDRVLMEQAVENLSTPAERRLPTAEIIPWAGVSRRV